MKKVNFTKMQSLGNDFIIIDNLVSPYNNFSKKEIKKICDRNYGVGCDQLLILKKSKERHISFTYIIFNKDATESGQCGNGAKCVAKYYFDKYGKNKKQINVETMTKEIKLSNPSKNKYIIDMGIPNFSPKEFLPKNKYFNYMNKKYLFYVVEIGNPHAIFFLKNIDKINIEDFSMKFSKKKFFKKGANLSIVEKVSEGNWKAKVYERGSGETMSCGSAACAIATSVKSYNKHFKKSNYVHMQGGKALVKWDGEKGDSVFLIGGAEYVFNGTFIK